MGVFWKILALLRSSESYGTTNMVHRGNIWLLTELNFQRTHCVVCRLYVRPLQYLLFWFLNFEKKRKQRTFNIPIDYEIMLLVRWSEKPQKGRFKFFYLMSCSLLWNLFLKRIVILSKEKKKSINYQELKLKPCFY